MKVQEISNARTGIMWAYQLRLKSGLRAMKLRKLIARMDEEMSRFDALKNDYVKATGKDTVTPTDPEYGEVVARINEALAMETDITVEPLIEPADLENVEVSAAELDAVARIGLLKEEPEQKAAEKK